MRTFILTLLMLSLSTGLWSQEPFTPEGRHISIQGTDIAEEGAAADNGGESKTNSLRDVDAACEHLDDGSTLLDEDETIFEDEPVFSLDETETVFGNGDSSSLDDEGQVPVSGIDSGIPSEYAGDIRWSWRYEFGYQAGEPKSPVTNRSALRLEWNRFFGGRYYAVFDGKLALYGPDDHRARAEETDGLAEADLREAYLQTDFNKLSLRLGKQIVIWGEADGAAVTDAISPRDRSEFVFTTLEDSRLGQWLVLGDFYSDAGTWSLFANPDPQFNETPESGTAYDTDPFPHDQFSIEEDAPGVDDTEFGFRWKRFFGRSDVAAMAADLVGNQPFYEFKGVDPNGKVRLLKTHSRFRLLGMTANLSAGNFLWKGELAYKDNRAFQRADLIEDSGIINKDSADAALGMEYAANSGVWRLGLEAYHQHILQWSHDIQNVREDETVFTGTWDYDLLNETLHLNYQLTLRAQEMDMIHKIRSEYEATDQFQVSLEMVAFDIPDEESVFRPFRDAHRVTVSFEYQF